MGARKNISNIYHVSSNENNSAFHVFNNYHDHTSRHETMNGDAYKGRGSDSSAYYYNDANHSSFDKISKMPQVSQTMEEIPAEERCGWGPLTSQCCQIFRNPKMMLFWLCCAGAIQGMVVNGFVSVVISTIEKRFDLASTESGLIASSYDIASVICLIPVSYFGGHGHKPRWLGIGVFIMALGSLFFALPHFTTGPYKYELEKDAVCHINSTRVDTCGTQTSSSYLSNYKYVLILGQLMHGIGATPLYTLGVTYLDENLKPKMTPVYVGIFYAMAIVGPAIGYLAGGQLLQIFTDVGTVDTSSLKLNPDSPTFIGAWWIGFLLSGFLGLIVTIPLSGFPKQLPGAAQLQADRVSEAYQGSDNKTSDPRFGSGAKDIPTSLKILLLNPTFMFLNLAGATEGLLLSGFTAFTPKFVQSQFSVTATWAAVCVGLATIPAGGGGTFFGGYLVRKLELKCAGIIKLCLISTGMSICLLFIFLVQCPNTSFAGISVEYQNSSRSPAATNLSSFCNKNCSCEYEAYNPVCGVDNVMYFSPCHAGCESISKTAGGQKTYQNCSCIEARENSTLPYMAEEGQCGSDCALLYAFLPVFALVILCTFITSMPALSATLRCVSEKQKSFALGIQWILVRCFGTIPAPILFGKLIDLTCILWQETCGVTGSCYLYDNKSMGMYLLILALGGKALSLLFFSLALCLYKAPPPEPKNLSPSIEDFSKSTSTMDTMVLDTPDGRTPASPPGWYSLETSPVQGTRRMSMQSVGPISKLEREHCSATNAETEEKGPSISGPAFVL